MKLLKLQNFMLNKKNHAVINFFKDIKRQVLNNVIFI